MRLSKRQKRMKKAVASLQEFMQTYDQQQGYMDYVDGTLINDVLYGIGIALDDKYRFADGFALFKKELSKHIAVAPVPASEPFQDYAQILQDAIGLFGRAMSA